MKKYVVRGVAALAALFVVVASFVPFTAEAAVGGESGADWRVDIVDNDFYYFADDLWITEGFEAVNYKPWSVRIGTGGQSLVFTFTVEDPTGYAPTRDYVWSFVGNGTIRSFTITIAGETQRYSDRQIASASDFSVPPYAYAPWPDVISIRFFGDNLSVEAGNVDSMLGGIDGFVNGQHGNISSGMNDLTNGVSGFFGRGSFFLPTIIFIGTRFTSIFDSLGDFTIVYYVPMLIGAIFVLLRHTPNSLRADLPQSEFDPAAYLRGGGSAQRQLNPPDRPKLGK